MMSESFKNMDGIFRNKLRDFSQSAPDSVWDSIEQSINKQKVGKKFLIYKIAAAIAAIAVLGSVYLYLTKDQQNLNNETLIVETIKQQNTLKENAKENIVETDENIYKEEVEEIIPANEVDQRLIAKQEVSLLINNIQSEDIQKIEKRENFNKLIQKQVFITTENKEVAIVDSRDQKVKSYFNTLPDVYTSLAFDNVAEINNSKEGKWMIGGEFSPLYSYRHITKTDGAYSKDVFNSTESAVMSYTGGLNLQFEADDRLTVQAGIYYTSMGQSLDYMSVYSNAAYDMVAEEYKDRFVNPYQLENSMGDLAFNSEYVIVDEKSSRVNNLSSYKGTVDLKDPMFNNLDAEIQQSFQYVEVPVLLRYKLIDKNIDFNIIGGLGANFLIGNDVYLKYADNKEVIGKTDGVSSVNYNGTLGFGIEYPLMDRIKIRLEPSVKYYLNEINSSSSVESHPYSIGIYTGINYSF